MQLYDMASPLDFRYYASHNTLFERLKPFVSEYANIQYMLKVEAALVKAISDVGLCPPETTQEVAAACEGISPEEVYAEEQRIQHNVRALVNCIRNRVSEQAKPYVHLFATSSDIMDTANAMRYRDLTKQVLIPQLVELERLLIRIARETSDVIQIGRTHGQHAVPITFGFAMAEYVSRLGNRILAIQAAADNLRGQISGAVGAYNAVSLINEEYKFRPDDFERKVLSYLELKPGDHSTQIVEPEYLTDLAYAVTSCFSVLACLADDIRHLERTEIAEIQEVKGQAQVGSSTMPHKANPKDFENIKSLWKAFMPRLTTVFMDQLSEHQRDLTNSASTRFTMEIMAGFSSAADRMISSMQKIRVNAPNMSRNLESGRDYFIAEALYVLLALNGHPNAHETIRKLVVQCQEKNSRLSEQIWSQEDLQPYLDKMSARQKSLLVNPERYTGQAKQKAEQVCDTWEEQLEQL